MKSKRIISALLALVMVVGMISHMLVTVGAYTNHSQSEAVDWIIARGNESWWRDVDGAYGCQCVDLIMAYYEYLVGYRVGGNGCDYTWNDLPDGWYRDNTPSPGSIAVWGSNVNGGPGWSFGSNGHVGLVYNVSGSTIYTVETNTSGSQNAKFKERSASCVTTYVHPDFSGSAPSYSIDTSYPTPFKAYTNSNQNVQVYRSVNGATGGWVYPTDECTVYEVYTNGWCKFECKWDDGSIQTRYAPVSIFNLSGILKSPANLGDDFTAPILNKEHWKIIENNNGVVQTANETGTANQVWRFQRQSDGSYKISSCLDGRCLDVANASSASETKVWMCDSNDTDAQRWFLYEESGGYIFKAKCTDCVLDLPNDDPTNGNQLWMYTKNGTRAQIWAVYRGDECKLSAPTLTVSAGSSTSNTTFTWSEVYGERCYDLYIWKNKVNEGDAYHYKWKANSGYSVVLPAGKYQAVVYAGHEYEGVDSNIVTFTVNPTYRIDHWAGGFKNGEGTNQAQNMIRMGYYYYESSVNSKYELGHNKVISKIPNGYYVAPDFGTPSISGNWERYPYGTIVTQKSSEM